MKKIIFLLLCINLLLVGCDSSEKEFDYSKFATLVNTPGATVPSMKDGDKVDFVAYITSGIEEVDEDTSLEFIAATTVRANNYFWINVTDIEETFEIGDVVNVVGKIDGYYYSEGTNSTTGILNIKASTMTKMETNEVAPSTDGVAKDLDGRLEITFKEAVLTNFTGENDILVIFYDCKVDENIDWSSIKPQLSDFYIYQGDDYLEETNVPVDVASLGYDGAINSFNSLSAGEEAIVYSVFSTVNSSDQISIESYDDEYNLTFLYDLTAKQ